MSEPGYQLKFWGVRGSIPTPARETLGYGGNTSCLSLTLGPTEQLVLDCGTGIKNFGDSFGPARERAGMRFHIFFTHYHLDHIEGLPFFSPLYDPKSTITFYGPPWAGHHVRDVLQRLVTPPYFPVPLKDVPSRCDYVEVQDEPLTFGDLSIDSLPLNHPNGSRSYRLERGNRRIVFATDHEHGVAATDDALVRFSDQADYLIYDATYVPSEYEMLRRGWGHSTWYEGVRVAKAARVKTLVLFHHHPGHTDEELEGVLRAAREELPNVEIAREGTHLPL